MVPVVRALLWTLVRLSSCVVRLLHVIKCRSAGDHRMAYRQDS